MSGIVNENNEIDIHRLPVNSEEHNFHDWIIKYTKSHILHSQCTSTDKCNQNDQETCQFCMYVINKSIVI